jgi:hypothetical protein
LAVSPSCRPAAAFLSDQQWLFRDTWANKEIAVILVDEQGQLELQQWVTGFEVAVILVENTKFLYYRSTKKDDKVGQILVEY